MVYFSISQFLGHLGQSLATRSVHPIDRKEPTEKDETVGPQHPTN